VPIVLRTLGGNSSNLQKHLEEIRGEKQGAPDGKTSKTWQCTVAATMLRRPEQNKVRPELETLRRQQ